MGNAMDKAGDGMSQGRRNAENKDGLHKTHNQSENGHKTSKGGKRRGSGREKDKGAPKELKNEINGGARSGAGGLDNSKNASKHKGTKRDADRKFDAIKESRDYDAKETKVEHDISLKDRISTTRRCRLNIPPYSRVPEPEYKIKLLVEETYEGPFRLLLRKNPCMLELASIDGLTLRSIKKSDILFIQTLGSEILKLFIKSEIDGEGGNSNDAKKSNVEIMMIVFKFTNQKDLESFEFFFPFMYGIILHSDKVKIPVADYIEFSDYIIGSNKNILKRMDEYKELSKNNGRCLDYEDESENEIDDNKLSNLYEEKMVQRERDFFTRKDLKINYVDDSFLGQEASGSANGGSDSLSTESMDAKNDSYEKKKEKYSKLFPISISGQSESGEIITFKDISHIGSKYKAEVIEWRLSTNIGGSDCLFSELPISVSKTFQINDDHIGRYVQAKVCRHIGQDLSEIFVFSQTQTNVIIPGDSLLMKVAELLIKGKVYRVDIPTYDVFKLLCVNNPQYYTIQPGQGCPMITCLLDIKYNSIKLIIPTPSILSQYYRYAKFIPLCFGYDEFIFTKKSDWYGYNVYPNIYESIYRQGELLSKVSLIMSFIDNERKDINVFFSTRIENDVVYNTVLFRQIAPNISIDEVNKEYTQGRFINLKKKFIYGFKKVDWKSRLALKDAQVAGTYIKKNVNENLDINDLSD